MLSEAWAQITNQQAGMDSFTNDIQFYLAIIQILWGIVMALIGLYIRSLNATLKTLGERHDKLMEKLYEEYAKKDDVIERVHGLRDSLGVHSTWIHILAHQLQVQLPGLKRKDSE